MDKLSGLLAFVRRSTRQFRRRRQALRDIASAVGKGVADSSRKSAWRLLQRSTTAASG